MLEYKRPPEGRGLQAGRQGRLAGGSSLPLRGLGGSWRGQAAEPSSPLLSRPEERGAAVLSTFLRGITLVPPDSLPHHRAQLDRTLSTGGLP